MHTDLHISRDMMQVTISCCTEEGTKQVCVMKGVAGDSCGEVYEEGEERQVLQTIVKKKL